MSALSDDTECALVGSINTEQSAAHENIAASAFCLLQMEEGIPPRD